MEVWIRGGESRRKEKEKKYRSSRGVWDEESRRMFRSKLGSVELGRKEIGEEWEKMETKVKEAIRGTEGVPRGGTEKKDGWWDKECIEKKKEVRKELRRCRRMGGNGGEYKRVKREYKALCERKKKEENDRWEKQVAEARRENEVGDY